MCSCCANKYTVDEDKELNKELLQYKSAAKGLISNNKYDSINLSQVELSVLTQITNAESHYDISCYLWNSRVIEIVLNGVYEKLKNVKGL